MPITDYAFCIVNSTFCLVMCCISVGSSIKREGKARMADIEFFLQNMLSKSIIKLWVIRVYLTGSLQKCWEHGLWALQVDFCLFIEKEQEWNDPTLASKLILCIVIVIWCIYRQLKLLYITA